MKSEREKAERAGQAPPLAASNTPIPVSSGNRPASSYTETRLRLQTPASTITKSFSVDTTLFEVAAAVAQESRGFEVSSFTQNFPKKSRSRLWIDILDGLMKYLAFDAVDFGATLKELSLVPSASLIVK